MEENYITKKILSDAKAAANASIEDAKRKAAERFHHVKEQLEQEESSALESAKVKAERAALRQKFAAESEVRRAAAIKKHEALSKVFDLAKTELLSEARYDALVSGLVKKYAQKGDTVKVSKSLPSELVEKFKLKQIIDNDIRGIFLSNATYELNLTIDELLKDFSQHRGGEVVKMLWGS